MSKDFKNLKAFETYNSKAILYLCTKSHHPQDSDTLVQPDPIPIWIQGQVQLLGNELFACNSTLCWTQRKLPA